MTGVMASVMMVAVVIMSVVVVVTRRENLRENSTRSLAPQRGNDEKAENPEADHLYPAGFLVCDAGQFDPPALWRPEIDQPSEARRRYRDGDAKLQGGLTTM